jgi:hypothetical protein
MTKFTLTIDTTGPAFGEWQTEAARILRAVARQLDQDDGRAEAQAAPILDLFGNPCGLWSHGREPKKLTTAQALEIVKLARSGDIGALYAALSGAKPA